MGLFSSAKASLAARKLAEERLYEIAVEEIAANNIRPGLWAKALAETDGNEAAAKARYIKLLIKSMKAEADLQEYVAENFEKERAETERREEELKKYKAKKAAAAAEQSPNTFKPARPTIEEPGFSESAAWSLVALFVVVGAIVAAVFEANI